MDRLSELGAVRGTWSCGSSVMLFVIWAEPGTCICVCPGLPEAPAEDVVGRVCVEISWAQRELLFLANF